MPLTLSVIVIKIFEPAFSELYVPACVKVIESLPLLPDKLPPVIVAVVRPS